MRSCVSLPGSVRPDPLLKPGRPDLTVETSPSDTSRPRIFSRSGAGISSLSVTGERRPLRTPAKFSASPNVASFIGSVSQYT